MPKDSKLNDEQLRESVCRLYLNNKLTCNLNYIGDGSHIFFNVVMLIASAFGLLKNRNREEKRKL